MSAAVAGTTARSGDAAVETGLVVAHVGLMGEQPGGMAQVVNEYLSWTGAGVEQLGILSARRKRDWAALALSVAAAARLLALAIRSARTRIPTVAVFHVSEGGSFVREGALLIGAHLLGLRTIAHIHGATFDAFAASRPRLVRLVLRHADSVAALTSGTEKRVRALLAPDADISLVRNIVPAARLHAPKEHVVLFGGELSERKGVDTLITAWERASRELPDWQLVLAGPMGAGFALPTPLPEGIRAIGAISHAALLEQLARASIAVLPSRHEALPMFLLEALAHGCATLGGAVGQVPALLADGVGVAVPAADPSALAASLAELMGDAALRENYGARGVSHVDANYSPRSARAELEGVWRRAALR